MFRVQNAILIPLWRGQGEDSTILYTLITTNY
jgi:hypothetical protein